MAKDKRKGSAPSDAPRQGDEEYKLPAIEFDERAFLRKEIEGARATFVVVGVGIAVGILARVADYLGLAYVGDRGYLLGWLVILASLPALAPFLRSVGYSDEATAPKAMAGNWFLLFFTDLALWVLLHNI